LRRHELLANGSKTVLLIRWSAQEERTHLFSLLLKKSASTPFSQKSRTPTVAKEFQIGLYDPALPY